MYTTILGALCPTNRRFWDEDTRLSEE